MSLEDDVKKLFDGGSDDLKDYIKKAVKDVLKDDVKPLFDDVKSEIKSLEDKVEDKILSIPSDYKYLYDDGKDLIENVKKDIPHIADAVQDAVHVISNLAETGLKYDEDAGKEWKQNISQFFKDLNPLVERLGSIGGENPVIDSKTLASLLATLNKAEVAIEAVPDALAGFFGVLSSVIDFDHLIDAVENALNIIEQFFDSLDSNTPSNLQASSLAVENQEANSSSAGDNKGLAIGVFIASATVTAIKEALTWFIEFVDLGISVKGYAGVSTIIQAAEGVSVRVLNVTCFIIKPIVAFLNVLLNALSNIQVMLGKV